MTIGSVATPTKPEGRRRRVVDRPFFGAVGVGLLLAGSLVAGCTSSGTAISTPYDTAPPVLEHGPRFEVKVQDVSGLGPVLVDGQGLTLYLFETDRRGSPSRCYDICAVQWPPLTLPAGVRAPVNGPGIDGHLLGTAPRTDGTTQVTYNGWPLYLWPPDRAPGKATGQGLTNAGGVWFVLDPRGNAIIPR